MPGRAPELHRDSGLFVEHGRRICVHVGPRANPSSRSPADCNPRVTTISLPHNLPDVRNPYHVTPKVICAPLRALCGCMCAGARDCMRACIRGMQADGQKVWRGWLGAEGLVLGVSALALLLVTTIAPHLSGADAEWPPLPCGTPLDVLLPKQAQLLRDTGEGGGDGEGGVVDGAEAAGGMESCAHEPAQPHRRGGSCGAGGACGAAVPHVGAPSVGHTRVAPGACLNWGADACVGARVASVAADATDACVGSMRPLPGNSAVPLGHGVAVPAATAASFPSGCGGGGGSGGVLPSALLLVLLGLLLSAAADPAALSALRLGPSVPRVVLPSWRDFGEGVVRAGLPQVRRTLGRALCGRACLRCGGLSGGRRAGGPAS
eukprot:250757-Chlamydomonas_euryale.AAC.1